MFDDAPSRLRALLKLPLNKPNLLRVACVWSERVDEVSLVLLLGLDAKPKNRLKPEVSREVGEVGASPRVKLALLSVCSSSGDSMLVLLRRVLRLLLLVSLVLTVETKSNAFTRSVKLPWLFRLCRG